MKLQYFNFTYCKNKDFNFKAENVAKEKELSKFSIKLPHDIALTVSGYQTADELYFSQNVLSLQDFEDIHSFYYTEFDAEAGKYLMQFNRIDLFAEIYLNGKQILETANAFVSHTKEVYLLKKNRLVIHLLPAMLVLNKSKISPVCYSLKYNGASLNARKPAYTFGWDIMPRNMLGGIFDAVKILSVKEDRITETYIITEKVEKDYSSIIVNCAFTLNRDDYKKYSVKIEGNCEESCFCVEDRLWSNLFRTHITIDNCKNWDVKNFGKPNLYTVKITLLYDGQVVDVSEQKIGVRIIKLERTSVCDALSGRFVFKINGRETFIMGTNWVPVDALCSKCDERLDKALSLLDDVGCNMVRVWGGGFYESDKFYEFCDEHGILVWQDFMMACAGYPQTDEFNANFAKEAEQVVIRLRNHPSLALWSGDNECDCFTSFGNGTLFNPNNNRLTRKTLPEILYANDPAREYIASSPFLDEEAYKSGKEISEDHCWGPRNFYKSDYYRTCNAVFISEIGYMGIPSVDSLRKFIKEDELNNFGGNDYLVHISSPTTENSYYKFRVGLNLNPIVDMFGESMDSLDDTVLASQITEAEALKYFIERMRINKGRKFGIMWWNLLDGWPQLSDSVVDYYFKKKLAYYFVKKSQQYCCLMMDESDSKVFMRIVNDTNESINVEYALKNVMTGEIIKQGAVSVVANGLEQLYEADNIERICYEMVWEYNGQKYSNHFFSKIQGISLKEYSACMQKCGFNLKI